VARSSTPDWDQTQAAAILPGVPLPDWAMSDEPFLPDLDVPVVENPVTQGRPDLVLDDLSISQMEAALREMAGMPKAAPAEPSSQAPAIEAIVKAPAPPAPRPAAPRPAKPALKLDLPAVEDLPTFEDDEPAPVEFARPGYPETAGVPQVHLPKDLPGYPTDVHTGAIVVPPPPPPRVMSLSEVAEPETYEPIRLDLPMSAVLAREFTRTNRLTHHTDLPAAPVSHSAPTPAAPAPAAPEPVAAPVVPAPAEALLVAPVIATPVFEPEVADLVIAEPVVAEPTVVEPSVVEPPAAPAKTSPRRLMILIGLGALLALLAAAAAFFLPGILNPTDTTTPKPNASSVPTNNPSGTTVATSGFVLQTPAKIGALSRLAGPIDSTLHDATTASVIPGLVSPISAVYGTGQVPHATVIAWKASSTPAQSSVSEAFAGFQSSAKTSVADIAGVSSTGLPGQMSCGETQINGTPTTLCFWADPATFGSITVVNPKTPAEGALTAAQIRSAVEVQQ